MDSRSDEENAERRVENTGVSSIGEHVRTVHFSLLLSCAALFISSQVVSDSQAARAYEQLRNIRDVVSDWNNLWLTFGSEQLSWLRAHEPGWKEPSHFIAFIRFDNVDRTKFPEGKVTWSFNFNNLMLSLVGDSDADIYMSGTAGALTPSKPPPHDIAEFKQFWNQPPARLRVIRYQQDVFIKFEKKGGVEHKRSQATRFADIGTDIGHEIKWSFIKSPSDCPAKQPMGYKFTTSLVWCEEGLDESWGHYATAIPIEIDNHRLPENPRAWIAKKRGLQPTADFHEAFPELEEVSTNYADLDLKRSELILEGERKRTADRVEMLGLKIPSNAIADYGPIVVLIVQVYLWLHLQALKAVVTPWNLTRGSVAWIGLYDDLFSKLACIFTTGLVPALALRSAGANKTYVIVSVVLGLISATLMLLVWRKLGFKLEI